MVVIYRQFVPRGDADQRKLKTRNRHYAVKNRYPHTCWPPPNPKSNLGLVKSGDLVEVELVVESKNDYEYIVIEDMKAAGFEPAQQRSGYSGTEMGAYLELRDNRVNLFVRQLARGTHRVSYRLRAEIPGRFSGLPTRAMAMYVPNLTDNSDEMKIRIGDTQAH